MKKEEKTGPAPAEGLAIGREEVRAAAATLQKYRAAKRKLEARIEENEQWFRMRHWEQMRLEQGDGRKASAWLFNSIMNKHADFMDAVPECTVLPREASDTAAAEALTSVLPVIFERCDFGGVYADAAMQKLKTGTAVYSVLWDPRAAGGMGDVAVTNADIFRVFWEPGVRDIQKSRNLFCLELQDNDLLVEQYPFLEGRLGGAGETAAYLYDKDVDTTGKSTVVDWYYKRSVGGRQVLHYVKFVNDTVLFASENEEAYRLRGWYDHGKYPFVFDPLFKEEGTPVGFGFIDVMKDAQEHGALEDATKGMSPFAARKNTGFLRNWTLTELRRARADFVALRERAVTSTDGMDSLVVAAVARACRRPGEGGWR